MESTITMVLTGVVIFLLAAILTVVADIRNSCSGFSEDIRGNSTVTAAKPKNSYKK